MPSDAERDALRERDPERIYLEPAPYSPEGRLWCEDDVWPLEGDGPSGVEYVRADLVRRELDAPADRDALWRDYEEARDKVIDHASLWGAGAAEKAPPRLDALDAAVRALAAGDGQDSRAWRPVDPNNLPEPQWMLVTNNIDARDARGDMSHLWLVYMLHAPSLNEPQYGVTAFSGNRRICYITHWRPAIPDGADRMIVAATDPEGA